MRNDVDNKTYRCKFCKVQVVGPQDHRPILGKEHKKSCRRHNK